MSANPQRTIGSTVWQNLAILQERNPSLTGEVIMALTRVGTFLPQVFLDVTKSLPAAYILARMIWKSGLQETRDRGGWSYEIIDEMRAEFYVGYKQQRRARKILLRLGIWEERKMGVPAKLYFRINWEGLARLISSVAQSSFAKSDTLEQSIGEVQEQPNRPNLRLLEGRSSPPAPKTLVQPTKADKPQPKASTSSAKGGSHLLPETSSEATAQTPLDRSSQDTRSSSSSELKKAERQFDNQLRKVAASKAPLRRGHQWPSGSARDDLRRGIYPDQIEKVFRDSRHLKIIDQIRGCVKNAVTQLVNNRPGKMMHLSADGVEARALRRVARDAKTFEGIPGFEARERALVDATLNEVVDEAGAEYENRFPPAQGAMF